MRGIACDDVRGVCYVADYDAHLLHVLKMDLLAAADAPAPPKPEPSGKGWTSELVGDGHVAAAMEATERIKVFMAGRKVAFNGAGEAGLKEVAETGSETRSHRMSARPAVLLLAAATRGAHSPPQQTGAVLC